MKVRCIASGSWIAAGQFVRKHWWSKKTPRRIAGPKRGDILTVEGEYWNEGSKYYQFMEWPKSDDEARRGYDSDCFKPIDEEQAQFEEVTFSEIKKEVPVSAN